MRTQPFAAGGYRFMPHAFQYSGGVVADPGFQIERARFRRLVPLAAGFDAIEAYLAKIGRPPTAFCASELRSPTQFSEQGFINFNRHYVQRLERWGTFKDDVNPVARSNVIPPIDPPGEPSFYAFSYTVPGDAGGFVAAGSGEAREGSASYKERIIRYGETSADAMRDKARLVLEVMEQRMAALGVGWTDATGTQLYTIHDIHAHFAEEYIRRGAAPAGLTWHYARPPVEGLEYEVDVRGVSKELVI